MPPATVSALDALIHLRAWVEHWQADKAHNLAPTAESLETALVWIDRGLASLRQNGSYEVAAYTLLAQIDAHRLEGGDHDLKPRKASAGSPPPAI